MISAYDARCSEIGGREHRRDSIWRSTREYENIEIAMVSLKCDFLSIDMSINEINSRIKSLSEECISERRLEE